MFYKRTKFHIPFYPTYINAWEYFCKMENVTAKTNHDEADKKFNEWMLSMGAHYHPSGANKQNHKMFFETPEQITAMLLTVGTRPFR